MLSFENLPQKVDISQQFDFQNIQIKDQNSEFSALGAGLGAASSVLGKNAMSVSQGIAFGGINNESTGLYQQDNTSSIFGSAVNSSSTF